MKVNYNYDGPMGVVFGLSIYLNHQYEICKPREDTNDFCKMKILKKIP